MRIKEVRAEPSANKPIHMEILAESLTFVAAGLSYSDFTAD